MKPQTGKVRLICCMAALILLVCLTGFLFKDYFKSEVLIKKVQTGEIYNLFKGHFKPEDMEAEAIPLVRSTVVEPMGSEQSYSYAGVVRGRYERQLAFQVGGKIISRPVDQGSVVKPGDVLMEIDAKDIQKEVDSMKAQVVAAESQNRLARDNLDRYEQLYESKGISKADYDNVKNAYDISVALLQQAEAHYEGSQNKLNYCKLYSDEAGIVAGINAEIGQITGAGQPVVTVVQEGEKEVEINVPENRLEDINNAQHLRVKFWALSDVILDGRLREVAPVADSVARTYKVRISLLHAPPQLKLGMTATVTVTDAGDQETVYLPLAAIYQTGDAPSVWIVNEGAVSLKPVQIAAFGDNQVRVEGLEAGETVVTAGVHKLREGQKVRIGDSSL